MAFLFPCPGCGMWDAKKQHGGGGQLRGLPKTPFPFLPRISPDSPDLKRDEKWAL